MLDVCQQGYKSCFVPSQASFFPATQAGADVSDPSAAAPAAVVDNQASAAAKPGESADLHSKTDIVPTKQDVLLEGADLGVVGDSDVEDEAADQHNTKQAGSCQGVAAAEVNSVPAIEVTKETAQAEPETVTSAADDQEAADTQKGAKVTRNGAGNGKQRNAKQQTAKGRKAGSKAAAEEGGKTDTTGAVTGAEDNGQTGKSGAMTVAEDNGQMGKSGGLGPRKGGRTARKPAAGGRPSTAAAEATTDSADTSAGQPKSKVLYLLHVAVPHVMPRLLLKCSTAIGVTRAVAGQVHVPNAACCSCLESSVLCIHGNMKSTLYTCSVLLSLT